MSDDYNNNDNDYWDDDYFERHRDDYSTGGSGSKKGTGDFEAFIVMCVVLSFYILLYILAQFIK